MTNENAVKLLDTLLQCCTEFTTKLIALRADLAEIDERQRKVQEDIDAVHAAGRSQVTQVNAQLAQAQAALREAKRHAAGILGQHVAEIH